MLPSENIELAIFRFVEGGRKGQWRSTSIATLGTAIGNQELTELVDALLRLRAYGHIRLRKWLERQFLEYPHPALDENRFFFQQDFQIIVTPQGRPYFEQLESKSSLEGQPVKNQMSVKPNEVREIDGAPTAFISYSWDTGEHKRWVLRLAERLRSHGVNVVLDHWHLKIGGDRTHFMETRISECQFVIIICTATYAQKANNRHGGVGYEAMIITSALAKNIQQEKFIPVVRSGGFDALPVWLQSKIGVDLSGNPYDEQQYELLLTTLHKAQPAAPPVGPKPVFSAGAPPKEGLPNGGISPLEQHIGKAIVSPTKSRRGKAAFMEVFSQDSRGSAEQLIPTAPVSKRFTIPKEKSKHDGDTIADNFLLGSRNAWVTLLEESWPDIGWPLSCPRDTQDLSLEDICKIFEPVKEKPNNPGLAMPFYRPSAEVASPAEVLANRRRVGETDSKITQAQAEFDECQRLCQEADAALKMVKPANRESIALAVAQRQRRMTEVELNLQKLKNLRDSMDSMIRDQEAYVFQFQLRDFLLQGGPAVNPHTLANALAGLPTMPWQQSLAR
jgi:hypothetical protein